VLVPDVMSFALADARSTILGAGFKVSVGYQDTPDITLDQIVIAENPPGDNQAPPGTTIDITIGNYVAAP